MATAGAGEEGVAATLTGTDTAAGPGKPSLAADFVLALRG
jgi:hypothetical protein